MNEKTKAAISAGLIAGGMFGSSLPVLADDNNINYENDTTYMDMATFDTSKVVESLYQQQMNALVPALEKLQNFYTTVDTNNIIKTAYKGAYEKAFTNLGYMKISYGNSNYYNYVPASQDYLGEIIKNNELIGALKIKPAGTGREPDYGIIPDSNSAMGFRTKTEEDRRLIDEYTSILSEAQIIDSSVISLIVAINNGEALDDVLLYAVKDVYQNQKNYLDIVKPELINFYKNQDSKNIIKNGFDTAYTALNIPTDDSALYTDEQPSSFIPLIIRNNEIFSRLRIDVAGNGREPDYGVIRDPESDYGFRQKTEEDKQLIAEYTKILGKTPIVSPELIALFNYAQSLKQSGPTR